MSQISETLVFDEEAIRDTSHYYSVISDNVSFQIKTLIIENSLNQALTAQCWGSRHEDMSNSFAIGGEWSIPASTDMYQTCDSYIPYWRIEVWASAAPTSGTLTVDILKIGG